MIVTFEPTLTVKQTIAWDYLEMKNIDEILYGGAKYGGKSWFLCVWAYLFACNFAAEYNIPRSDNPLPIGFLGRKVAANFKKTTLETWYKTIPSDGYVAKDNPVELIIDNRVKIHTGGLDNRETINKFNSAEYAFFAIDQAEEVTEDDIALLRGATFGRLVVNNEVVPGKGLFTANPRNCWLKDEFIYNPTPQRRFIPALPTDNPYCTQRYIDKLTDAFKHRPAMLKAFLHGDWSAIEGVEQVIKESWLRELAKRSGTQQVHKRFLVCDTATFGDDECVIMLMDNAEIEKQIILPQCNHNMIANRLAVESKMGGGLTVVIEVVGADTGEAVLTDLKALGVPVIRYTPQGQSQWPDKFYNQRAEAWYMVGKILGDGIFDKHTNCPAICKNMDNKTKKQLCAPTFEYRNDKILIEPKTQIKARLIESPDRADTYIMGLWAWRKVPVKTTNESTYSERNYRSRLQTPMTV